MSFHTVLYRSLIENFNGYVCIHPYTPNMFAYVHYIYIVGHRWRLFSFFRVPWREGSTPSWRKNWLENIFGLVAPCRTCSPRPEGLVFSNVLASSILSSSKGWSTSIPSTHFGDNSTKKKQSFLSPYSWYLLHHSFRDFCRSVALSQLTITHYRQYYPLIMTVSPCYLNYRHIYLNICRYHGQYFNYVYSL